MKRHEEILHEALAFTWNNMHRGFHLNIQRLICNWNNGESGRSGNKMLIMGVKKGIADFSYLLDHGRIRWIELKTIGGTQSKEQIQFEQLCLSLGHEYVIARSWDEFWTYLDMPVPEIPDEFKRYIQILQPHQREAIK